MTRPIGLPDIMPKRMLREFERWRAASKTERRKIAKEQARMRFRGAPHSSYSCAGLPADLREDHTRP